MGRRRAAVEGGGGQFQGAAGGVIEQAAHLVESNAPVYELIYINTVINKNRRDSTILHVVKKLQLRRYHIIYSEALASWLASWLVSYSS